MTSHNIQKLLNTLPQIGTVKWIGLRPSRRATMIEPSTVEATTENGLVGDRYSGKSGKRHITLIQHEHLSVIASVLGIEECKPALLRRNIVVSNINLLALKGKKFQAGDAILEYTGLCHPCSLMEKTFGVGGYNAVRGHGGITAKIVKNGLIRLNDTIEFYNTNRF